MQSFKKKIKSILKDGLDPIKEGINNFTDPKYDIECLAKERLNKCLTCPLFKLEPIPLFRVKDTLTPEASNMFCDGCGCTISYKIRQSLSTCDKWNK